MKALFEVRRMENAPERAVLAAVSDSRETPRRASEQLDELALLAKTAGALVVGRAVQARSGPDPAYYMGSGRVIQLAGEVKAAAADLVIFNDDLSPSQIRNLEKVLAVRTIDRSMLILDIFSRHARTRESKVQVELAQISYLAPRLTRLWSHLGQQAGMSGSRGRIATRGPGEKQLELDRRLVKKRIADLKTELSRVDEERRTQKKMRQGVFRACLAGYTNVGKSSLLNVLSGASVLVEDKLFATLDATTRKVFIPGSGEILLSDTVGFIRKLPHHLVASFKSTLEVITDANLILPVMDASSDRLDEHMETVNKVLNELETIHIPKLLVFNKIDLIDGAVLERLKATHPEAAFVSALKREGLEALKKAILSFIKGLRTSASAKEAAA